MSYEDVIIIRDALPERLAEYARTLFLERSFDWAPFGDPAHYARTFPDGGFGIPSHDELYTTDFHRLPSCPEMQHLVAEEIVPLIRRTTGRLTVDASIYFYKLHAGGHLRLHKDDYAGHTGFVWHLSKGWKWDWGGLMIAVDGETASVTLPVFNSLVILDHSKALPHLVSQVAAWAKEPRMMVTGILR